MRELRQPQCGARPAESLENGDGAENCPRTRGRGFFDRGAIGRETLFHEWDGYYSTLYTPSQEPGNATVALPGS